MGKPEDYRDKAIQLSEMAERSRFPEIARQCRQLAREYHFLASLADFPKTPFPEDNDKHTA
jgi:hypothetical protein